MGYEERSKAYQVYDIEEGQVIISRDVTICESIFAAARTRTDSDDVHAIEYPNDLKFGPDDSGVSKFKQAGRRKNYPTPDVRNNAHRLCRSADLEEASAG